MINGDYGMVVVLRCSTIDIVAQGCKNRNSEADDQIGIYSTFLWMMILVCIGPALL